MHRGDALIIAVPCWITGMTGKTAQNLSLAIPLVRHWRRTTKDARTGLWICKIKFSLDSHEARMFHHMSETLPGAGDPGAGRLLVFLRAAGRVAAADPGCRRARQRRLADRRGFRRGEGCGAVQGTGRTAGQPVVRQSRAVPPRLPAAVRGMEPGAGPGAVHRVGVLPLRGDRATGLLVFAGYNTPGAHRLRLDQQQRVWLRLDTREMRLVNDPATR